MADLKSMFQRYFEIIPADSPGLREEIFRMRYKVYCMEGCVPGFEAYKYPEEKEIDRFDRHSVYSLLRHKPSGAFAGSVRLILADRKDPERPLPIEERLYHSLDPDVKISALPRRQIAEVSRLVVTRQFRCRSSENFKPYPVPDLSAGKKEGVERRNFPGPAVGLAVSIIQMCLKYNIRYLLAAMEPGLNQLLKRFMLHMKPIAPTIEYYGPRRPYLAEVSEDSLNRLYMNQRDIWDLIHEKF